MSTLHFGPEWMRAKPTTARSLTAETGLGGASSYSALVSAAGGGGGGEDRDSARPFRYSKDELLTIFRDGAGAGATGLGLEVERWEGVVREAGTEPTGLRDMGDAEKKLFAGPLNSDLRRRQSADLLSPLVTALGPDRPRLNHSASATAGSPRTDRFGQLGRRRGESTDQPPTNGAIPRKLSLTALQTPMSPRDAGMPSPRVARMGGAGFDGGVFAGGGGESWTARRRASEGAAKTPGIAPHRDPIGTDENIKEEDETVTQNNNTNIPDAPPASSPAPPGLVDLTGVEWSYLDPQGNVQGPFRADVMQKWHDDGYFTQDLLMKRTKTDSEWTTVADLRQRASGPLFLTPHRPPLPPGLQSQSQTQSPMFPGAEAAFTTPFQPAPIRSLRSSTLDSFLTGSNPSDSPSSSLGAGRYSNGSPDFGGRADVHPIGRRFFDPSAAPAMPTRNATIDMAYSQSPWQNAVVGAGFDPSTPGRGSADMQYAPYGFNPQDQYNQPRFDERRDTFTNHDFSHAQPAFVNAEPAPITSSPWGNLQHAVPRQPGPFDSNYPTSANTVIDSPAVPWGAPTSVPRPGVATTVESSPWGEPLPAAEPSDPTPATNGAAAPIPSATVDQLDVPTKKARPTKAAPSKPALVVPQPVQTPPSPVSPAVPEAARPAWAKAEEAKPSGVSLSLREIQDAEAKKAEARKAAEKERERARASVAPATPSAEDMTAFTASWGLPTSQAGAARTPAKEAPIGSAPVWTTTVKAPAAKKTMKEIQEEEEKRKKQGVKESLASVAARRGYAETTFKQPVPSPQAAGGAWSTVGPSGKSTPLPTAGGRPAAAPTTPAATPGSAPRTNGVAAASRTPAAAAPTKPATPKVEDFPAAPSHEFLKWLTESLDGLNKTVNVEEIIQMLLSFPIDPDPSTVELIAEMIYANSKMLDGRRFAADFVSKRRVDVSAAGRDRVRLWGVGGGAGGSGGAGGGGSGGGGGGMGGGKPISIAEVVKAQPKAAAAEWGFKVVNKKKKGGRA